MKLVAMMWGGHYKLKDLKVIAHRLGLTEDTLNQPVSCLSGGSHRLLSIALALIGNSP